MPVTIDISPDEQVIIDVMQPTDTKGVGELFRSVYGEDYPVKLVYDPEGLIEALEEEENIPVVARSTKGPVVGYVSLFRSSPSKTVYEEGQGLVNSEYRKYGIFGIIIRYLAEKTAPLYNVDAVFGESVCNHLFSQKAWSQAGAIETALEVDLMPAETYAREGSAKGRVASLHMTIMYRPLEHAVHAPKGYEKPIRFIYDGFTSGAYVESARDIALPDKSTFIESSIFESAGVCRLTVWEAGTDFRDVFERHEAKALGKGMVVVQVWLNLSWPWVGQLTEYLRERGYFFGGILPRWFGPDGLLMQKVTVKPNWEGIELYSDRARRIRDFIREDYSTPLSS